MDNSLALSAMGMVRVAAVSPESRVADVEFNTAEIVRGMHAAAARGCAVAVFPELCITGYSCADLFYQRLLIDGASRALAAIAAESAAAGIAAVVGLPIEIAGRLFNCAALVAEGVVKGIVPKTVLPNTGEFYERRWFSSGASATASEIEINGQSVPFGTDLLFRASDFAACTIGIEICEDLWSVQPPSGALALSGATIIVNPSASNELLGKSQYRRELVRQQSARCLSAYVYAGAGPGESTTDVVYSGHSIVAEYGTVLGESEHFQFSTAITVADIDLQRLTLERMRSAGFSSESRPSVFRAIDFRMNRSADADPVLGASEPLYRPLPRRPFVPSDDAQRAEHCREIVAIQSAGLAKRLRHTGAQRVVLGLSGGLDSTLALLVTVRAFDSLELRRRGIVAIGMPGFGTTPRTRNNAERLAAALGVTWREISIAESVRQHFTDIGHDESTHDITYENAQARERTQILMDVGNEVGGFVVGTGDLSELALGWCTFNADHMSMYHVNAGVPKTLVRYIIDWFADSEFAGDVAAILHDISATPISPELLPLGTDGSLQQHTEDVVGPYDLHDFFLFHAVRFHAPPRKILALAERAFAGEFPSADILRWLGVFYDRFFGQQFKRSAMPDGPKVGSVALSPRGDWRMPSDASVALWKRELADIRHPAAVHV